MLKTFFAAAALAGLSGAAGAMTVDFEGALVGDAQSVGTSYSNGGITFTSTETMTLVRVGGVRGSTENGFWPMDTPKPDPTAFGEVFLTGDFKRNTDIAMTFGGRMRSISFDVADIDGGNDSVAGDNREEQFTFSFYLDGELQGSQLITSDDVTGDAQVNTVSYFGLFDRVEIVGVTPGGKRSVGWGLDNINVAAVPLPAGALLLLSGIGALGVARRRRSA